MADRLLQDFTDPRAALFRRTYDYLPTRTRVQRINRWLAIKTTDGVGTMWCAYAFALLALVSLPATLVTAGWVPSSAFPSWLETDGLISFIGWVSSYFIQLVLLSVIMVGQNVQAAASDDRTQKLMMQILDRLDPSTDGGIQELKRELEDLRKIVGKA